VPTYSAIYQGVAERGAAFGRGAAGFRPQVRRAMMQALGATQKYVVQFIRNPGGGFGPLIASKAGGLVTSWTPHLSADGMRGNLDSSKIHSSIMDGGRKAGARMPPVEAIERWLRDKGIVRAEEQAVRALGGFIRGGRRARRQSAEQRLDLIEQRERAIKRRAWAIARSIAKRGIKGRNYVPQALKAAQPHVERAFHGAADWAIKATTS
jgi:hypothetical protein